MKQLILQTALSLVCAASPMAHAQGGTAVAPIAQAAGAGQADTVAALLAQGANPDVRDAQGRTPLMLAASAGHYETVRRLLSAGAQKNLKDNDGKTALDLASEHRHMDLVALMREAS